MWTPKEHIKVDVFPLEAEMLRQCVQGSLSSQAILHD